MLTFPQAVEIAKKTISNDVMIIDSETIEKNYAWIFFYITKRYYETGDIIYALGGNSPLFISKTDGHVSRFPTGLSIDGMIEAYEEKHKIWSLVLVENIYTDIQKLSDLKKTLGLSNSDIADYKKTAQLTLDTGSEIRLSTLQKSLNEKNIQTELVQQSLD